MEPLPAHEIPALLAATDMVPVPLKIHIPGAVLSKLYEAMASGRPVVLVASGGAATVAREHQARIVVEPGDVTVLLQAVKTLYAKPNLRRVLGENGRRAAEQHFDWVKIAARFITYLEANL